MLTSSETRASPDPRRVAQAVRNACIEAALAAYERASTDGLCGAGAWECAIEAIRALDLDSILHDASRGK